jgi:cytochrome c peroxidase
VRLVRAPAEPLSAMARLGQRVFSDPSLSASGTVSCASCHRSQQAYASFDRAEGRAIPSLMYLERQPIFSVGPDSGENENPTPAPSPGSSGIRALKTAENPAQAQQNVVPQGGLFWDGRADTLQGQALVPLLDPAEMNGGSVERVADKLRHAPYAAQMLQLFGARIFAQPNLAVSQALFAVARYQIESRDFHPYASKFDRWLEGKARLSPPEARGYALFNDPKRANCAACHLDGVTPDGLPPLFTDHQYEALGVPRNAKLVANRDPHYYDLGICGPIRTDMKAARQYCGMFLTPTLRNVATRRAYFHNGVYRTLRQVLDFYNFRDTRPARIYPAHRQYDDLPATARANLDTTDAPFDRKRGDAPPLGDAEESDIIAFLRTLTDDAAR